ncbi:MAG: AEC family transporter [Firmicutes bacterium]|nr:AEC family transporter [[Eubacterium] siraeum]MCM1488680.1 AEC family transporter [Bacillota bacterium]
MTDAFVFAANAVLPIVLMIALGYVLKRIGLFSQGFLDTGNKLTFRVLIPSLLYYNIYGIGSFEEINFGFVLYGIGAIAAIFLIATAVTCLFTKDGGKRGALIQSAFRSNYAIIGLPLASALFGDKGAAAAGVMSAFCVPTFNILAVITLTIFNNNSEKGKIDVKKILIGIAKNPLIIATVLGLLTLAVRELFVSLDIGFRLRDIEFLYKTLENLKSVCTPFALLVLGGKFEFSAVKRQLRYIVFGTLVRTVAVPVIALSAAYFLIPGLSGEHYATYIAVFGTPVAVASAIMAKEMGADDELAGQLVVWTSLVSTVTIFIYVVFFRSVGIF